MVPRHAVRGNRPASTFLTSSPRLRRPIPGLCLARHFHPSRPNRILAEALQLSHTCFQEIHHVTGLPWALSIPLTACLFRLAWIPVHVFSNRNAKKYATEGLLLVAWRQVYQKAAARKFPGGTEANAQKAESWVAAKLRGTQRDIRRRGRYFGPLASFGLQMSFFPIWIFNADVIRRMAGDDRTLLSLFLGVGNGKNNPSLVPAEPDFLNENLGWISNLTLPDHLWILPISFGALSVASAYLAVGHNLGDQMRRVQALQAGSLVRRQQEVFLQLSQFIMAASFVFPVLIIQAGTPTAVVLYLLGSVGTQLVQRSLLDLILTKAKPPSPLEPRLPEPKTANPRTPSSASATAGA